MSTERELQNALMESRSLLDDIYATIENIQVDGNANVEIRPFNTAGQRDYVIPNYRVVTRDNMMSLDKRKRSESLRWHQRRRATAHYVLNQAMTAQNVGSGSAHNEGVPHGILMLVIASVRVSIVGPIFGMVSGLKDILKIRGWCISDLHSGDRNETLEAKGNAIRENMGIHYIPYFSSLLQDGSAYRISDYKIPRKDSPTLQKQPTLTDYIGCITQVGNFQTLGSATTNQINIKKLDIENLNNGDVVELTL
ncbi:hypothetical protein Tco_0898412 [Tanacetum coccineum]